jgi:hypothetical protein
MLVRTVLVTIFLAGAAWVYGPQKDAGPDPRLGLIALGYGVTAISSLVLPRVRHIVLFAGVQVAVDLLLVTLVILATGGLASPLAVLYNVVILNSAQLRLGRGIMATAAAAAVIYGTLAHRGNWRSRRTRSATAPSSSPSSRSPAWPAT